MSAIYIAIVVLYALVFILLAYLIYQVQQLKKDLDFAKQSSTNCEISVNRFAELLSMVNRNYFRLVSALTHKPLDSQRMEGGKDDH